MKPRLELLRMLLHPDKGSIWITIDDDECHYLKVMCDEVFGRQNFVSNVIWEKKSSPQNDAKWISDSHDHILVYAKRKDIWRPFKLDRTEEHNSIYKHSDEFDGIDTKGNLYGRGPWFPGDMTVKTISEKALYPIKTPSGKIVHPARGRAWVYFENKFKELVADNRITFGKTGGNKPCIKRFLSEIENNGIVPKSVWYYKEVGENRNARQEVLKFNNENPFATPKPEKLLERIITIASQEKDIVLDSFLGSATTSAVAHKMKRKWIGIELGEHAYTHCKVRLDKVIDGTDQGGISKAVEWKGGGGYKFYELAPSFVVIDEFGNPVIDSYYNDIKLIKAMCKLTNYTFAPSQTEYWKHGKGQGNNSIYVTTQMLSLAIVQQIASHLKNNETLLICPKKYEPGCENVDKRITIKKIPQSILKTCQFGKKEYLLPIKERVIEEIEDEESE